MNKILLTVFFLLVSIHFSFSQGDDPISPDRPGYTNPPSVVPLCKFQVESGFNYEYDNSAGLLTKNILEPTTLLRYGILKNFEIRIEVDIASQSSVPLLNNGDPVIPVRGLAPIIIGTKYYICKQKNARPETAFSLSLTLPYFGNVNFRPQYAAPGFAFLFQNTFSEKFSIGYNAGMQWNGSDANPTSLVTFALNYNLTKKIGVFAELYSFFTKSQVPDHRSDFGLTYLVLNNLMIDVSGGPGISSISPNYFINGGISLRLPR